MMMMMVMIFAVLLLWLDPSACYVIGRPSATSLLGIGSLQNKDSKIHMPQ